MTQNPGEFSRLNKKTNKKRVTVVVPACIWTSCPEHQRLFLRRSSVLSHSVSTWLLGRVGFLPGGVVMGEPRAQPLRFRRGNSGLSPRDKRRLPGSVLIGRTWGSQAAAPGCQED